MRSDHHDPRPARAGAGCAPRGRYRVLRRTVAAGLLMLALTCTLSSGVAHARSVREAPEGVARGEVAARRSGGSLERMSIDLVLERSGVLRVHEEFVYTLGADEQHGFRRFIPVLVNYDDRNDRRYLITDVAVTAEPAGGGVSSGSPSGVDDLALAEDNDNLVIRIGSPSTYIYGTWRYGIDYTVHDVIDTVDARDLGQVERLVWNVVGTEWAYFTQEVTARLAMPAEPLAVSCFQGSYGSVTPCRLDQQPRGVSLEAVELLPYEAVTFDLDFPQGTFEDATAVLEERWSLGRAMRATPVTVGGSLLGLIVVLGGLGRLLGREARDRRLALNAYLPADADPETEGLAGFFGKPDGPVQFRPPDGMTPGLCGVLLDEKADALDVSATIVDLAVRGFLRIEQLDDKRKPDFLLRFLHPAGPGLNAYETKLLAELRSEAQGDEVRLSTLRTKFATQLKTVQKEMYVEVTRRRWFLRRPDRTRALWAAIGLLALVVGGGLALLLVAATTFGLFGLPLVAPGLLLLATARRMPARTAEGRRQLELCVGYERFLEVADVEELRFAERQYDYIAGLPYAMVFGLTDRWARVLAVLQEEGLDLTPTWFVPYGLYGPFRYDVLGSSMNNFTNVAAAALSAPAPSSSGGGFSGGGFSGGGGGGGGGGGW